MNSSYPCIKVCDIETMIDWYVDFLGFQCIYKNTLQNPDSAIIEKENQKIYLLKDVRREAYASNILILEVSDLKAEYADLENSGAIIVHPIQKGNFSGNDFVIKDYEDNKIVYVQKKT